VACDLASWSIWNARCGLTRGSAGILFRAVDGVSLTVAALRDLEFDVMIIPFTWQHTNVHALSPGDRVNLECDMIGKYVARATQFTLAAP
jgi:riboflavin synthase alpha subunit